MEDNSNSTVSWNMSELTSENTAYFDEDYELEAADGPLKFSPSLLLSFTICFAFLVTFGLLGNTMVIFALFRTRAHRATTTNAYILNLSIADLLFLLFCVPFQGTVYILNDWPYGQFMCKAAHFCQYWTMYSSVWLLAVMSVDRYLAIGHPLKSVDWRSPGQATRICCYVWLISAALSIPWWILYRTETYLKSSGGLVTACFDFWGENLYEYRKWLFLFVFITGFVFPSCVIFCMAILVARSIRNAVSQPLFVSNGRSHAIRRNSRGSIRLAYSGLGHNSHGIISKRRRRVVWLVFGLALTFFLCWLPQKASIMWVNFYKDIAVSVQQHYKIYFIVKVASHMLTYVNSSINPVLYSLASGRFRSRLSRALFMKNASIFNDRGTVSRIRSALGNRNVIVNGHPVGTRDNRSSATDQAQFSLLPNNTNARTTPKCYYRRTTESDLASNITSTSSRTSSLVSHLIGPGPSSPHFPQIGHTNLDERSFRKRAQTSGKHGRLDRLAMMNTYRQRASTWSTMVATNSTARNNTNFGSRLTNYHDTEKLTIEEQEEGNKGNVKKKHHRFPLFWRL